MVTPVGLTGAEMALAGGLDGSIDALLRAQGQARNDLISGTESALAYLNRNTGGVMDQIRQGQGYLSDAYGQGVDALGVARDDVNRAFGQGVGALKPYAKSGIDATNYASALSGAQGNAAQQAAFQQFNESPGQAFLREQGEQAVLRNASALGGLGGANVMKELTRFGTGLAQQDFNNMFNRVSSVADRGANAAGQMGNLLGQQGQVLGSLGQSKANLASTMGQAQSGLAGRGAELLSRQGQMGLGVRSQLPGQLAQMGMNTGNNIASLISGTGNRVAQGRTDAGNAIANAVSNATNNVANLQGQQGAGVSDVLNQDARSIAQLLGGYGNASADDIFNLIGLLSNVSGNAQNAFMGVSGVPNAQETGGLLGNIGNFGLGVGGLLGGLADYRNR